MKVKCIVSNFGTKDIPGCGAVTFKMNEIKELPPAAFGFLTQKYPGRFVESAETPKEPTFPLKEKMQTTAFMDMKTVVEKKSNFEEDFE